MNHLNLTATEVLKAIPSGPIDDPSAWKADDVRDDPSWRYELDGEDLAEIGAAVTSLVERGLTPPHFDREDFAILKLGAKLAELGRSFEQGRGFFLVRGLPVDKYPLPMVKTIYWGIGTHLGCPVFQNLRGELISHVADRGDDYNDVNVRLYTTRAAAFPHNDPSDAVGLLCIRGARSGGASMIVSATAIFNEVLATRPEYLEILFRGFPHDTRGEGQSGALDETTPDVPVFSYYAGKLSCCLNSKSSQTARIKQGRPFSAEELAAVRYVESLAERTDLSLSMDFQPGDMQFLNNYTILHTRTAFENGASPEQQRLLLRIWLNLREGRALAPGFGDRFNNGSRGGVPATAAPTAA
jgi:hypothetical protein